MAEIEMEPKRRSNAWIWIAAIVLVALLAVGAWFLFARGDTRYDTTPAAERTEQTQPQGYESPAAPGAGDPAPTPVRPDERTRP
jgi:flagellar basal body-associated protein FliL